jgi:hypothetical protein
VSVKFLNDVPAGHLKVVGMTALPEKDVILSVTLENEQGVKVTLYPDPTKQPKYQ